MTLIRKIYRRWVNLRSSCFRRLYRCKAIIHAHLEGGKLCWPHSASAVVPVRVDGKGLVEIGDNVSFGFDLAPRFGSGEILLQARDSKSSIIVGYRTATSNNVSIVAIQSVRIGEGCLIGDGVTLIDCDFHEIDPVTRKHSEGQSLPVVVGNNVWLGSRVMVLKGTTIGDNTVVAAGSVVTKSLPSNVIAGGIPARVIRSI